MTQKRELTILQINDTHGYLDAHQELFWEGDGVGHRVVGGYAKISGLFNTVRQECGREAVLALDNGDTLHGTFPAVHSQGEALIAPLNKLALDAWTVHWDMVYGPRRLQELATQLDHPLLAINAYHEDGNEPAFRPSLVLKRGGITIGVIGIAAYIIDKVFPQRVSTGLRFTLGRDELPAHIRHLREHAGAELIVVLSHLGFPQDCKLATEVAGIDVLLSGHTHNRMVQPVVVGNTTIIQSGCHASFVGRLDIEMDGPHVGSIRHRLITLDDAITPDAEMQALVDGIYAPHRNMLAELVGETATALNRSTTLEATMDNLVLDALADAAGMEIAFSNGWRYGAPIPIGNISINDLWNIIPTNPPVETVDITGAELWDMMEENLERTFSSDAYKQMGGYVKRCRGVKIYVKIENPAGMRIQDFFAQGERLEHGKTYRVAFVTEQGVPQTYGHNRRALDIKAIDALKQYLVKHTLVHADLRGTVVAV